MAEKSKPGRQRTEDKEPEIIAAIERSHGNLSAAARILGITRKAVDYYVRTRPHIREIAQDAANAISDIAEGNLIVAIKKGDLKQSQYWLESKARDRGYGQKYTPNVTLAMQDLMGMNEADLDKLIAQLSKLG